MKDDTPEDQLENQKKPIETWFQKLLKGMIATLGKEIVALEFKLGELKNTKRAKSYYFGPFFTDSERKNIMDRKDITQGLYSLLLSADRYSGEISCVSIGGFLKKYRGRLGVLLRHFIAKLNAAITDGSSKEFDSLRKPGVPRGAVYTVTSAPVYQGHSSEGNRMILNSDL